MQTDIERQTSGTMSTWGRIASVVAGAFTLLMITPFAPAMPFPGLDGSWSHAMNVATAGHLRFGHDIVFTFGPLASIYTRVYHPGTDWMMVLGSMLVAVALFAGMFSTVEPRRRLLLLLLPLVLSLGWGRDAIFLFVPILLPFVVSRGLQRGKPYTATLVLLSAAAAILPVVKGNFSLLLALATLASLILSWRDSRRTGLLIVLVQGLALVAAWAISGQKLLDLPGYFIEQAPIISGYTDAMSVQGPRRDIFVFLFAAMILLGISAYGGRRRHWYAPVMVAAYLFVSFKSGFVRHDGHALTAAVALAFVGLLLCVTLERKLGTVALVVALLGWGLIGRNHMQLDWDSSTARFSEMVRNPVKGAWMRVSEPDVLPAQFEATVAGFGQRPPFAGYTGDADVYPVDLASMLGAGSEWKPRPILQSYSAYTPGLLKANAAHLASNPPSRVYFSVDPIDHRYPSLEDGASWLSLLGSYRPKEVSAGYAVLERIEPSVAALQPGTPLQVQAKMGVEMPVAGWEQPVWATMDIRPTLAGKIYSMLFKAPKLSIRVRYENGTTADFRLIAGMTSSGFLLSPTVSDGRDFTALRSTFRQHMLDDRRVVSFNVVGDSGTRFLWDLDYKVTFAPLTVPTTDSADEALGGVWKQGAAPSTYEQGGDCNIDQVDDRQVTGSAMDVGARTITIRGWAALDGKAGQANEKVTLLVNNREMVAQQIPVSRVSRPDVAAHFNQPGLEFSGYEAYLDVYRLPVDSQIHVLQQGADGRQILCSTAMLTLHRTGAGAAGQAN